MLKIIRTNNQNPHFKELIKLLDEELWVRNGEEQRQFTEFNIVKEQDSVIVVYVDGVPAGCGCFRTFSDTVVEIKRMYVRPEHRKKGTAYLILDELEKWAKELQFSSSVLETGTRLPEAINLYKKCGYKEIEK